jgi:hypothetical protein
MPEKPKVGDLASLQYDYLQDRYRQRAKELASKSQGLERLCYQVFGYKLMGSLAFAIDPWARFRFPKVKATLVNRKRVIPGILGSPRSIGTISRSHLDHWSYYPSASYSSSDSSGTSNTVLSAQSYLPGFIKDTTVRTRPYNSTVGEYELFLPTFVCAPFEYDATTNSTTSLLTGVSFEKLWSHTTVTRSGPAFRIYKADVDADAISAKSRANAAIAKNALGLVSRSLPTSRKYNLFYQLAELKDVPQLVKQLVATIRIWGEIFTTVGAIEFGSLIRGRRLSPGAELLMPQWAQRLGFNQDADKTISNLYLSFKFGWESLLSTINGITSKPAQVARATNSLLRRNGTASNFRSGFSWIETGTSPVNFEFSNIAAEAITRGANTMTRKCELRCVVNATFDFPQVDVPAFRALYFRKLGLDVSPLDLINLIPWSWLIDWFLGYSSYLQMMDALWNDKSLINFGFITYREMSEVNVAVNLQRSYTTGDWVDGSWINSTTKKLDLHPSAFYRTKYQLRLALSSVAGIVTPDSASLSSYQKSILSALFAKATGLSDHKT